MTQAGRTAMLAFAGLLLVLYALLVAISTEAYLYSRNTLIANGRWVSSKVLLELPPMGSHHFLQTRNALQGNQLQLGAWHGGNEVHLRRAVDPGTIELSFEIEKRGFLSVQFNRDLSGYDGLRLSRDPEFPSMAFRADASGRFVRRVPLTLDSLGAGVHDLSLDFLGEHVRATLDGETLAIASTPVLRPQWFGFRNGQGRATIDDVRVTDRGGALLQRESFRNTRGYVRTASFFALGWGLVLGAIWLPGTRRTRAAPFRLVAGLVVFLLCGAALASFDFFAWSKRYPYEEFSPLGDFGPRISTQIEQVRRWALRLPPIEPMTREELRELAIAPLVAERDWDASPNPYVAYAHYYSGASGDRPTLFFRNELAPFEQKSDGALRVFFVGGSQTYGEGSDSLPHGFVGRLHGQFASLDPKLAIETFNFAYPGADSGALLELYETRWLSLRPDLVVASFGFNDQDPEQLFANTRRFVELSRQHGVAIVLIVEPTTWGEDQRHRGLRALGQELGVETHDLNSHMNSAEIYDIGFLWWDYIHPSSLGHELIAEWLAPRLAPVLEGLRDR